MVLEFAIIMSFSMFPATRIQKFPCGYGKGVDYEIMFYQMVTILMTFSGLLSCRTEFATIFHVLGLCR